MTTFLRHTFRGASNLIGATKITLPGYDDTVITLDVPKILTRIYDENAIMNGLKERAEQFVDKTKSVIVDAATQRTFETGKAVAKTMDLDFIEAVPTTVNNNADPVVSAFVLPYDQIRDDRFIEAARLREYAHKIARNFLRNLRLHVVFKPGPIVNNTKPTAWQLLGLPDLSLIAETVVMSAGYPIEGGLVKILKLAGWRTPKIPGLLALQGQLLIGIQHQIDNPPGKACNYTAATPSKYILDQSEPLAVSHDTLMLSLLTAIGLIEFAFPLFPFQKIHFETDEQKVLVTTSRFKIDPETGSVTFTYSNPKILGIVKLSKLQKLANNALPVPERVRIPI